MSIAILTQVYDEMRRLAIAGSVVAAGDFRLKKLIPPLEQAGAKAPVFAKVAESIKQVVDGKEQASADALLELATLVNAILYTQGETGAAGPWEPIETTDLGSTATQASARVLKPLLEALTTTGSGRVEIIRDAHERGAFRDLRLVKPALEAIDDVYGEIGDFIAEKVLPIYGKAILPELRTKLDLKGKAGHPRRLRLLHQLDPAGSRDLVKQVLDSGSKEMKVVAIECLGGEADDLSYLLEQASAKAQEVRQAAYRALAGIDQAPAVLALHKAMNGKDLELAQDCLRTSQSPRLLQLIISEVEQELTSLGKKKDKKAAGESISRLQKLASCLDRRQDKESERLLLKLFNERDNLAKLKGEPMSGTDLNSIATGLLARSTKKAQEVLASAHATIPAEDLDQCFHAARRAWPSSRVFETFSPYLTANVDEKKKQRDPAWARRNAFVEAITEHHSGWQSDVDQFPPLDPRWLDIAVRLENLQLVQQLVRPGHAASNKFLQETFDAVLKKSKAVHECHDVLQAMAKAQHPGVADAFVAVLEKHGKKADYYSYWFGRLVPELPKSALPKLEALLPNLHDRVADALLDGIHQLRMKA